MKKIEAILVAAGSGKRMNRSGEDKIFVSLSGCPILCYSLKELEACRYIEHIVLVVRKDAQGRARLLIDECGFKKVKAIVAGGLRRQDSVSSGLAALDRDTHSVLIHDGARPFLSQELLERLYEGSRERDAVICGLPLDSTIKRADDQHLITETVSREAIWVVQTPQMFARKLLLEAFRRQKERGGETVTDEASLIEKLSHPVGIVQGDPLNIKITYEHDLVLARLIAATRGTGETCCG
ncbi:MAG: 2-C-methyl-D-erythritol 4-phosphate cytidylyltransferase [Candidatus Omnitrophica bacterium]|nr:2-C-methyl-D-erythritol 4-phosphate cytidylyltransferase [Candidatus Omnitrophota bacterium]